MKKLLITLIVLLPFVAMAQTSPFDYSWNRTKLDTLSGQVFINSMPHKVVVKTDQKQIATARTFMTGDPNRPESIVNDKYALNGEPVQSTTASNTTKRTVLKKKAGGKGFAIEWTNSEPGQPDKPSYSATEDWTLTADGKTLTIVKTFKSSTDTSDQWSARATYSRE